MHIYFFSKASQRSGILNPWIWLANSVHSSRPDFPIRTPRTDRSEFSNIEKTNKHVIFRPRSVRNIYIFFTSWVSVCQPDQMSLACYEYDLFNKHVHFYLRDYFLSHDFWENNCHRTNINFQPSRLMKSHTFKKICSKQFQFPYGKHGGLMERILLYK